MIPDRHAAIDLDEVVVATLYPADGQNDAMTGSAKVEARRPIEYRDQAGPKIDGIRPVDAIVAADLFPAFSLKRRTRWPRR